jgi:hypothetical protein
LLVGEACRDFEPSPVVELQNFAIYIALGISRQLALGGRVQVVWSNIPAGAFGEPTHDPWTAQLRSDPICRPRFLKLLGAAANDDGLSRPGMGPAQMEDFSVDVRELDQQLVSC